MSTANQKKSTRLYDLPIGERCVWYRQADTKQKPNPAVVKDSNGSGSLSLILIPVNGGTIPTPINGVRHIDDEYLKENPEAARRLGAWESIEDSHKRALKARAERKAKADAAAKAVLQPVTVGSD